MKNHVAHLPKKGRGQLTKLAAHLNVNTTLISQVMTGGREFSEEQALDAAEFFGLLGLEKEYFLLLVQFERAGTQKLKKHIQEKLQILKQSSLELKNRVVADKTLSEEQKTTFYSTWLFSAVRMFCSLDHGKTLDDVIQKFQIDRLQALMVLKFLLDSGLCVEKNGMYKLGTQSTFIEQTSPHYMKHLSNWRLKAISAAESPKTENFLVTAPMSLSKEDYELIREKLMKMLKEVIATVKDSKEETVACLNIDFFKY